MFRFGRIFSFMSSEGRKFTPNNPFNTIQWPLLYLLGTLTPLYLRQHHTKCLKLVFHICTTTLVPLKNFFCHQKVELNYQRTVHIIAHFYFLCRWYFCKIPYFKVKYVFSTYQQNPIDFSDCFSFLNFSSFDNKSVMYSGERSSSNFVWS